MDKIKRFFECYVPVSVCNIECSYCYVVQQKRNKMKVEELDYTPEHIAKALRKERVGGTCWINLCGLGETTAHTDIVNLTKCLLDEGHYVSITTNGTLSSKFDDLIEQCKTNLNHLHFAFSLHYVELLKRNWLDRFFDNVNKVRNAGASILVQINMCDEYMPYIEDIKKLCLERIGAYPQVALTRNEKSHPMSILTSGTVDNYIAQGAKFNSPLFDFTVKNFMVKRKEFCYAGDWAGVLNLKTGIFTKCYNDYNGVNIFENIDAPIPFEAVGNHCNSPYCVNSSHFMSLGVIPEIETPTYAQLRNRDEANWYSNEMKQFLNGKLKNNNKQYGRFKKFKVNKLNNVTTVREFLSQFGFYKKLHELKNHTRNSK